jgi:cytochrome c556
MEGRDDAQPYAACWCRRCAGRRNRGCADNSDHRPQAKLGIAMIKGEAPFDLDKAKAIFATFIDAANKMPELLPENSKTGEKTAALPAIWENMADVKARFAKLGEDAKAAQSSVKDLDSFKAAFSNIGKNDCGACHEHYRRKET